MLWRTSRLRGGGREGGGSETPQMCGVEAREEQPRVPAAVQHFVQPPGSTRCKRARGGPEQQCRMVFLRREGSACHSKWGFVSFVLFLAPAWRAVLIWESIPRHYGSKVLVALIFISLGPFESHCPPNEVENGCGVEDRCISRGRKINLNMSGKKQKFLLDFLCVVLIHFSYVWLLELHETY